MVIAIGVSAVIVIAAIVLTRRYPFEVFAFFTRRGLAKSGLTRKMVDGLVYWVGGHGDETLVLVHGVNDQAGTWTPVVPHLIKRYRLIAPDLPGHGESAPAAGPLNLRQIVDGFAKILATETGDIPVVIVGNSMGGWISLLYTIDHPAKVKRLILEDSSGMSWDFTGVPLLPQTREQAALAMRLVLGPNAQLPPNYVLDAMVRRSATAPMLRIAQTNPATFAVDNRLGEIKTPVTMIWGDSDGVLPLPYAQTLQSRIANAQLHVIDSCGHIPHRQKPQQFVALLHEAIDV